MYPCRESREDADDQLIMQGLRFFQYLCVNSHCSPRLGDGFVISRVCEYASGGRESPQVQDLARKVFFHLVRTSLEEIAASMVEGGVLAFACEAFVDIAEGGFGDIDTMLMIAEGLLTVSQRALQLQGRDVLRRACDLYHLESAIAG
jgi:hypothetical protein